MNDFFAMGGYGFYVWGAYGATAIVIALEIAAVRSRRRAALAEARAALADESRRVTNAGNPT